MSKLGSRLQDRVGTCKDNPKKLKILQDKVSTAMTKLATQPKNGGHPFLFALTAPKPHELRTKIGHRPFSTAATDGKQFYWHPDFLEKLTSMEISTVMMHEGYHVLFWHVPRGDGRRPEVWNWAIDYVVNAMIETDHQQQQRKGNLWGGNLGNPLSLKDLLEWIDAKTKKLPQASEDSGLIFADVSLQGRSPESIYEEIMRHVEKSPRKCPACGSIGQKIFGKGNQKGDGSGKGKGKGKKGGKGDQPGQGDGDGDGDGQGDGQGNGHSCGHDHGDGDGHGDGDHQCETCGGSLLPMDEHIRPTTSKEAATQEALRAADVCRKMRGMVPSSVEDELGELVKPTLTWQDLVRNATKRKKMDVGNKNTYKRFRRRPISFPIPMYMPRKYDHKPKILAMLDTSGSMGMDEIIYGISQLQVLGDDMDVIIVPVDAEPHWNGTTQAKTMGELKRTKIIGRGGTVFDDFFRDFPSKVGKDFDVVVVITDGYCGSIPMEYKPPMDVVWVITTPEFDYEPSFGRVAPLRTSRN